MPEFFRSEQEQKTYKLDPGKGLCFIYHVQVSASEHSFTHARGRYHVADLDTARKLMQTIGAVAITEQDYINSLKDYFAIDKRVREQFIKTYNL